MTATARILFALFLSLALCLALFISSRAAFAAPVQGTDYSLITPPQQPTTADKVEVIEFFSYACPHCFQLQPLLNEWRTELPANAVLIKVPVAFGRREWGQLVRAYYTLEATGDLQRLDDALFNAIHREGQRLFDLDALSAWAGQNGVNAHKFRSLFNSPEITEKALRAEQLSRDYKIDGVPTVTVAGRYRALGKNYPDMLRIARELIDQASGGE